MATKKASRGARSMWKGSISFGLVNVPIRLQPAIKKRAVHFHLVHDKDNARLKRRYICSLEHKEVPDEEIKKAYDVSKESRVIVESEELEKLHPKGDRSIDILYFVGEKEVDPAFFDTPYYLQPEPTAQKAYALLVEALQHTGKAGVAQFVLREHQYVGLLRADGDVLSLETMHFDDEVVKPEDLSWAPKKTRLNPREVKAAEELIDSLATPFDPTKLHDDYREAVLKLIDRKAAQPVPEGKETREEKEEPEVIDLISALKRSLEQVKKNRGKKAA